MRPMNRSLTPRLVTSLVVLAVALAACGGGEVDPSDQSTDTLRIVVTTDVLADVVAGLVGGDGQVSSLVASGQDPHTMSLSARQVQEVLAADLVVANGLGLEAALSEVLDRARDAGVPVLEVAPSLDPLVVPQDVGVDGDDHQDEEHAQDDGHGHAEAGELDPHVWLDAARMARGVSVISEALARLASDVAPEDWEARAEAVSTALLEADERAATLLSVVPSSCRRLVTNHDSLRYFAERHDFEIAATVLPGLTTDGSVDARRYADLVELLESTDVPAIFVEASESDRLAADLAADLDRPIAIVELYAGSLGPPGSGAETYVGLIEDTAAKVAAALADCEA